MMNLSKLIAAPLAVLLFAHCGSVATPPDSGPSCALGYLSFNDSCSSLANAITNNPSCADAGVAGDPSKCPAILNVQGCTNATQWCADGIDAAATAFSNAPTCAAVEAVTISLVCK
jgi:hypothetical protein